MILIRKITMNCYYPVFIFPRDDSKLEKKKAIDAISVISKIFIASFKPTFFIISWCLAASLSDIKIKCFRIFESNILSAFSGENSTTNGNISRKIKFFKFSFVRLSVK